MMSRYAHATYCDDIRAELNGKISMMGLYTDTMLVSDFPLSLKLCAVVVAKTTSDNPFTGFNIKVTMGEVLLAELSVSQEEYETHKTPSVNLSDDQFIQGQFTFAPLLIESPCKIEITFASGNDEYKCNSLNVVKAPEGMLG